MNDAILVQRVQGNRELSNDEGVAGLGVAAAGANTPQHLQSETVRLGGTKEASRLWAKNEPTSRARSREDSTLRLVAASTLNRREEHPF